MNLKNQRPIFVPPDYWHEFDKLSKAALMDMVWDYAQQAVGETSPTDTALCEFRKRRDIILTHRKNAKAPPQNPL